MRSIHLFCLVIAFSQAGGCGPRWFTIACIADLTGGFSLLSLDQTSILHSDHRYNRGRRETERERGDGRVETRDQEVVEKESWRGKGKKERGRER